MYFGIAGDVGSSIMDHTLLNEVELAGCAQRSSDWASLRLQIEDLESARTYVTRPTVGISRIWYGIIHLGCISTRISVMIYFVWRGFFPDENDPSKDVQVQVACVL